MKNLRLPPSFPSNFDWPRVFTYIITASSLVGALAAGPAYANDISGVNNLLRSGQYAEALGKADAYLAQRPRDPQMRFLKGVILTEQNKIPEAIAIFAKLTEDFPDLPEPYNNLAVLYAAEGQFDKARAALEKAIRTNPAYATAYENLGDVHAKLASQAYDRALQLDSKNNAAKSKLTLVRGLVDPTGNNGTKVAAAAPARTDAPATPAAPAAVATPAPEKKKPAAAENAPAENKPAQVASASPNDAKEAPKPAAKQSPDTSAERAAVLHTVNTWAKAWSAQDVKAYLSYYSSDFDTPGAMSRKAWMEERQARIVGKGSITVKVDSPQVVVNGNTATVKFRQRYVSDRLTANSRKTLEMVKVGGKWQIKQERTGN